ncbi:hypothetical protein QBC43DRAFT_18142 [Cladorrhinum sp. PSN259]|nr:hypothetical protein QBC43DRAFT_18142 [Cladorrhinum sp. PSN259]
MDYLRFCTWLFSVEISLHFGPTCLCSSDFSGLCCLEPISTQNPTWPAPNFGWCLRQQPWFVLELSNCGRIFQILTHDLSKVIKRRIVASLSAV